jgi:protein-disulfide isomerase
LRIIYACVVAVLLPASASAEPVATVAGDPISREELEKQVRPQLIELENQRFEVLEGGLDEMIAQRLLAKEAASRGVTIDVLRQTEITSKVTEPTDIEIQAVYDRNKDQIGGQPLADIRDEIVAYLKSQRETAKTEEYLAELRKKYETKVLLLPPVVQVATGSNPPRGGAKAPVTVVAFSDFECPFCKRAEITVERVLKHYGDKLRYFHRDFPLPFHANAHDAAEAARCAGDQGRYWDYYTTLFASTELSTAKFQEIATGMQLDRPKFDECLASGQHAAAVDKDLADGEQVGVNGTPAFFVNGRMLSGAQPFEKFQEVIDAELARLDATPSAQ